MEELSWEQLINQAREQGYTIEEVKEILQQIKQQSLELIKVSE